ncbi:MAG: MMPL family transporter [Spirochaetales bacterium]|nr:MMPL family transporter [Spirochaetales bacterium]
MKSILKKPKLIILITLLITVGAGILASRIVLDNDVKIFFPEDDPSYLRTKDLDKTYGSQLLYDISITTEKENILTKDVITMISKLTEEFENLEGVQSVTSLSNTDFPDGSAEGMSVSTIVPEDFSGTSGEIEEIRRRLLDWPEMYERALYSDDFRSTQMMIQIDDELSADEQSVLFYKVMDLIEPYNDYPLSFRIAGEPVITQKGKEYMYSDLMRLIPFITIVLFLCLLISFRRLSATVLPLITVLIATIWTVATMALFKVSFTIISSCLPVLIIAVGSAYGIHIINHFYHYIQTSKLAGPEAVAQNLASSTREVLLPIFLAGFTTVVGFLSIVSSPIVPLKAFGIFAAIGTLYSLILSLTLIPALLLLSEKRKAKKAIKSKNIDETSEDKGFVHGVISLSQENKGWTVAVVILLIGFSTWGLFSLNVESSLIKYFPYNSTIRSDSRFISDNFAGTNIFNIVITAPEGKDLTDPEILKEMDDLKEHLMRTYPEDVGKIISFSDFIKRMNRVMNFPMEEVSYDDGGEIASDSFFGGSDDGMGSFFDESDSSMGSFFDESDDGTGSFFDSSDDGMGSFFDDSDDSFAASAEAETVSVEQPEYKDLSTTMTYNDLILLLQSSITEAGTRNIDVDELIDKIMASTNYRGAAYNEIPYDPAKYPVSDREELKNLISQYLLLYSGSLDDYTNDPLTPTQTRMMVQLKSHSTGNTAMIIDEINRYAEHNISSDWSIHNAGIAELELALTNMITTSQVTSLLLALISVFLIIAVSYRSLAAGVIGIIPLALSILANFGLMSLANINLDMVTALISSIAIGIGVDYTVHFLARYKIERAMSDDLSLVTKNTILSTGKGIIINAISVALGFSVLMLSRFIVLRYIGFLTAVIMITSSLSALTILPLILNIFKPSFVLPAKAEEDTGKDRKISNS